jgi:hypothetical protein
LDELYGTKDSEKPYLNTLTVADYNTEIYTTTGAFTHNTSIIIAI